jgi:hypothetical protein
VHYVIGGGHEHWHAESVVSAGEPQTVPVVPPSDFAPATAKPSMSRSMAGRLVRRAIVKSLKATPRGPIGRGIADRPEFCTA